MFNRIAGLLSRIRPRRKTLTEEERLNREEARLQTLQEAEDRQPKNKNVFNALVGRVAMTRFFARLRNVGFDSRNC